MVCDKPAHPDCRRFGGPFIMVDADTGAQMSNLYHTLNRAFRAADRIYKNRHWDYRILNQHMIPVTRQQAIYSWLHPQDTPLTVA